MIVHVRPLLHIAGIPSSRETPIHGALQQKTVGGPAYRGRTQRALLPGDHHFEILPGDHE